MKINILAHDSRQFDLAMKRATKAMKKYMRRAAEERKKLYATYVRVGNTKPIYAIPDWVCKMVGVDDDLIQKVTLKFDNQGYAMAEVEFAPDAETVRKAFEGTKLIICGAEKDGEE